MNPISRRDVLKAGAVGALGLSLPNLLRANASAAPAITSKPFAKAVIEIWMWGGMAHIDTFDPKPGAGNEICGPLDQFADSPIPGYRLNGSMPLTAQQAKHLSVIRGMTHGVNGHETATYLMQTGRNAEERLVYPSLGAVIAMIKGEGHKGIIPPYINLTTAKGRFSEEGCLGSLHKPFTTGGDPSKPIFEVEGIIAKGITDERQAARRDLMHSLDSLGAAMPNDPAFRKLDACEDEAYDLIMGEARELFNLANEDEALRDAYGRDHFGQSCLMARRLVEHGVLYVTINCKGWDTHKEHFPSMARKLPSFDRGLATLLEDLHQHGLLDSTIVFVNTEFGRTPEVQWDQPWNGGRGHYGRAFSVALAGGGFEGGHIIGATDEKGRQTVERPVYPEDLIGSIYERMGINPDGNLPNPRNAEIPLTLPSRGEGRLYEIMPRSPFGSAS